MIIPKPEFNTADIVSVECSHGNGLRQTGQVSTMTFDRDSQSWIYTVCLNINGHVWIDGFKELELILLEKGDDVNRQEMIEKLKANERPFGMLSKEEQDFLYDEVPDEFIEHYDSSRIWEKFGRSDCLFNDQAYRLAPDYAEEEKEEEYVYYPIHIEHCIGSLTRYMFLIGNTAYYLATLHSYINFRGIEFEGNEGVWSFNLRKWIAKDGSPWLDALDSGYKADYIAAIPKRVRFAK